MGILDSMGVQVAIVLTWSQTPSFLGYEEKRRGLGRFRWHDPSSSKMFLNEVITGFHFCWVEGVDFGNFGDKVRVKFNDVVIGMMGGELVMSFLREDIHKVFAPFRYN